jgi:hypothetical protein
MPIYNLNTTTTTKEDVLNNGVVTQVTVTATSTQLLAANPNRGKFEIYNSGSLAALIAHNATVTATTYEFPIPSGDLYISDDNRKFLGPVVAITSSGTTTLQVTEFVLL